MKVLKVLVATASLVSSLGVRAEHPSAFTNQSKPKSARVTMLAVVSSSRQSFAGNREVYLADVQLKGGEHQFVRLIDQYPGYGLPIRDSLLRDETLFTMKVTREPECDVPGSKIVLVPTEKVVFNASMPATLASRQADLIPCFKALHNTIRIAKKK